MAWDVDADPYGDAFVAHGFSGTADFGDGPRTATSSWDVFLAKYGGDDGALVWGQHVVGADGFVRQAVDAEGNLVFAVEAGQIGSVAFADGAVAKLDGADGKLMWTYSLKNVARPHVAPISDGGVMVIGERVRQQRPQVVGLFIARIGADGRELWAVQHDEGRHEVLGATPVVSKGVLFSVKVDGASPLSSTQRTGKRILIGLVDLDGNTSWVTTIRSTHANILYAKPVGESPEGVVLSGTFSDEVAINDKKAHSSHVASFLVRLSSATGEPESIVQADGDGGLFAFVAQGRLFAHGNSTGELRFGSAVLSESSGRFVAELDFEGRRVWSAPYSVSTRGAGAGMRELAFADGRLFFSGFYSGGAEFGSVTLKKPLGTASMIGCYTEPPPAR